MSANIEKPLAEQSALLEIISRYKLVIIGVMVIFATASFFYFDGSSTTLTVNGQENTVTSSCGPPLCPARKMKDPITGACTIPC